MAGATAMKREDGGGVTRSADVFKLQSCLGIIGSSQCHKGVKFERCAGADEIEITSGAKEPLQKGITADNLHVEMF